MRLIHNDIRNIHFLDIIPEQLCSEALRRHIQEFEISECRIIQCQFYLPMRHTGIYAQCLYATVIQILYLILHQSDKRSHDNGNSFPHQCRNLEADRLASTGGQKRQHIPVVKGCIDYLLLFGTEGFIPPIFLQYLNRRHLVIFLYSALQK